MANHAKAYCVSITPDFNRRLLRYHHVADLKEYDRIEWEWVLNVPKGKILSPRAWIRASKQKLTVSTFVKENTTRILIGPLKNGARAFEFTYVVDFEVAGLISHNHYTYERDRFFLGISSDSFTVRWFLHPKYAVVSFKPTDNVNLLRDGWLSWQQRPCKPDYKIDISVQVEFPDQ